MNQNDSKIREFILSNVGTHSSDIVPMLAQEFGVSRQSAHTYVMREVKDGNLVKVGNTRGTRYFLIGGNHIEFSLKVKSGLSEEQVWSSYVRPMLLQFSDNLRGIAKYVFTEIYNNALDHSQGNLIYVSIDINNEVVSIRIMDNGIGIFQKIQNALHLNSKREAILHLAKGKFTTDPSNHTGEGIFFSSRICDRFAILSDDLFYTFREHDWILSNERKEDFGTGTEIQMSLSINSSKTLKEVMDEYTDQEIGFSKTIVAVALSADPNDPHVSRSQAKRIMMGVEKFRQIVLDFKGVESVGPAFVDEIFRVFQNEYPNIKIQYFNANEQVDSMIRRGLARK